MGGILQPPCPCGRNIGRCCLPQTRLLAQMFALLAHPSPNISSFFTLLQAHFFAHQLIPLAQCRLASPPPNLSHPFPNPATNRSSPPLITEKNKQRIQAYRRRMKQDGTLNKLHLHQPQFLPFFTSPTSRKTLNTLPDII